MKNRWVAGLAILLLVWGYARAEVVTRESDNLYGGEKREETVEFKPGQVLVINSAASLSGSIRLSAAGDRCHVKYQKRIKASSQADAERYALAITVELDRTKEGVTVSLRAPADAPWSGTDSSGRLEVEVVLPQDSRVEINTAHFDVDAKGPFAVFVVSESFSRVSVEEVTHSTEVKVSSRPVNVSKARGEVFIVNEYGDIRLEDIATGEKTATIRNDHAGVMINNFRGRLDVGNSYERITARNLWLTGNGNRIKNISGPILLSFDSLTAGQIRVNNNYGRTAVDVAGRVDARFVCKNGKSSRIIAEGMDMKPLLVEANRLEFQTGAGQAEVRIYSRGEGDIIINGSRKDKIEGEQP